jgi:7-cyano-7-deazaguanine synthase in queuosine biosynthesis
VEEGAQAVIGETYLKISTYPDFEQNFLHSIANSLRISINSSLDFTTLYYRLADSKIKIIGADV